MTRFPLILLLTAVLLLSHHGCSACTSSRWEDRIRLDFEPFQGGITKAMVDDAERRTQGGYRIAITNQSIYAIPLGWEEPAFADPARGLHPIFELLSWVTDNHTVPDVEFVLNIYDRRKAIDYEAPVPLLSWVKDMPWDYDILYPYWQTTSMNASVDGLQTHDHPWASRRSRSFFRGSTTGGVFKFTNWRLLTRSRLVSACVNHTRLCDAGITRYVQTYSGVEPEMRAELGEWPESRHEEVSRYKFNIVVDGNAAPSQRLAVMLHSKSTLLKQESPSMEWYYDDLVPYVHYVPLSYHASDVVRKTRWCMKHEKKTRQIADNAYAYARSTFTVDNIACYFYRVLQTYADLQKFEPAVNETYVEHQGKLRAHEASRQKT